MYLSSQPIKYACIHDHCYSLIIVFVNPTGEFITTLGGSATYTCTSSGVSDDFIQSVQWLVNDVALEEMDNVVVTAAGVLRFLRISVDYNNTSIRCRATLTSGSVRVSGVSLLLIQG